MPLLEEAIASGQVSPAQIEAHRAAGELSTPCLDASMGKHACANRAQCWEPCGELGHSAKHARAAGDLPIVMFETTSAAWTPEMLREADSRNRIEMQKPKTLREIIDGAPPDAKTCDWIESDPWGDMPSTYQSGCGEAWSFIDGGPKENNVRFCHGCGCAVSVVQFTDDAAIKATS